MSEVFCLKEYQFIVDNYTKLKYLEPLITKIELVKSDHSSSHLKVTWIEQVSERVFVDHEGWYVNPSEKYPTFEALAMKRSGGYHVKWGEALTERLNELDQLESDWVRIGDLKYKAWYKITNHYMFYIFYILILVDKSGGQDGDTSSAKLYSTRVQQKIYMLS